MHLRTSRYSQAKIAISTCNIVAFTTTAEISDSSSYSWGFHVYVADINTPWFSYKYDTLGLFQNVILNNLF